MAARRFIWLKDIDQILGYHFGPKKRPESYYAKKMAKESILRTQITMDDDEVAGVHRNLDGFVYIISYKTASVLGKIAVDLLAHALPRTPVDTGELRESGTATVDVGRRRVKVGTGTKAGIVNADFSGITVNAVKRAKHLSANVGFTRFNEKGEDIAFWTHEDLLPYDSPDHPRARTPFTGPFYLKTPFEERAGVYEDMIAGDMLELADDIKRISKVRSRRNLGKFAVDQVDIVTADIMMHGYSKTYASSVNQSMYEQEIGE